MTADVLKLPRQSRSYMATAMGWVARFLAERVKAVVCLRCKISMKFVWTLSALGRDRFILYTDV